MNTIITKIKNNHSKIIFISFFLLITTSLLTSKKGFALNSSNIKIPSLGNIIYSNQNLTHVDVPLFLLYYSWDQMDMSSWSNAKETWNNTFGEGNWIAITNPFEFESYNDYKNMLEGLEDLLIPFLITEQSSDGINKVNWYYNKSTGIACSPLQLSEIKENYAMFKGLRTHEVAAYACQETKDFIEWALSENVELYWNFRGHGYRACYVNTYTSMLFTGTYANIFIPLWTTNTPQGEEYKGYGSISLGRGLVTGLWLTEIVNKMGISFQDWYWRDKGYVTNDQNGTNSIPTWCINNALWFSYLTGCKVIQLESNALLHNWGQTELNNAGNKIKDWFSELIRSNISQPTKQDIFDNQYICFIYNSEYTFPIWRSMTDCRYNDLRKYHFWTTDYFDSYGELITSQIFPIFGTNEWNESIANNFDLIIFTDGGIRNDVATEILESTVKNTDVLILNPHKVWVDITSFKANEILGLRYLSSNHFDYYFEINDKIKLTEPFSHIFYPNQNLSIGLYDNRFIETDNTFPIMKNIDKNISIIIGYHNNYNHSIYTILNSNVMYGEYPFEPLYKDILGEAFQKFYQYLNSKYGNNQDEFTFIFSNKSKIGIIYPYENPSSINLINYTFSRIEGEPYISRLISGKDPIFISEKFNQNQLLINILGRFKEYAQIQIFCSEKGEPLEVKYSDGSLVNFNYDSNEKICNFYIVFNLNTTSIIVSWD